MSASKLCEDCGNWVHEVKKWQGLLLCANCYEARSGKPFIKYSYPKIDWRKEKVGKTKK